MTHSTLRLAQVVLAALLTVTLLPGAAQAQESPSPAHLVAVDVPGLARGRIAADADFCAKDTLFNCYVTAGISVNAITGPRKDGASGPRPRGDVEGVFRLRFAELNGAFVGLRTGLMFAAPFAAAPSLGLEVGASSLIAHRLYVGASVGARKVFLLRHGLRPDAGPSFRLVAGVAF